MIKEEIKRYFKEFAENKSGLLIGAVDGCKSLTSKESIGAGCVIYTYGYVIIKGKKLHNDAKAGRIIYRNVGEEVAKKALGLILTYLERKCALSLVEKCDYVLIDGSFFGFIYSMLRLKKLGLLSEKLQDMLIKTVEITNKLIEKKKVIGVVKRTHTRAIGAWYFLKNKDKTYCDIPDRLILSYLMQPKTLFDYREITEGHPVQVYNEISLLVNKNEEENILEKAINKFYEPFKALNIDSNYATNLRRIQVKAFRNAPTCEIEHPDLSLDELLRIISSESFFNNLTGLPIAIDIIDELVRFPNKLTGEYITEVEAKTVSKLKNKIPLELVKTYFSSLNPQK